MNTQLLHSTCVEINGKAALISGKPGSGKTSLAIQLIDRGALLVADDQTIVSLEGKTLIASPPPALKGFIEVRGVGICPFPYQEKSSLALCVEICEEEDIERLPKPLFICYYNIEVRLLKLKKFDPLGAIKVELMVCQENESYVQ